MSVGDVCPSCGGSTATAAPGRNHDHHGELAEISELYAPGHHRDVERNSSLALAGGRADDSGADCRISKSPVVVRPNREVQRPDKAGKNGHRRLHGSGLRYGDSFFTYRWLRVVRCTFLVSQPKIRF